MLLLKKQKEHLKNKGVLFHDFFVHFFCSLKANVLNSNEANLSYNLINLLKKIILLFVYLFKKEIVICIANKARYAHACYLTKG